MNKNVHLYRSTMRGLRKCPSCGYYNGNRAKGCAHEKCSLHFLRKSSDRKKPLIDAVQLISHNDTKLYSVRVKDRDPANRNFVQIIDITLTADQDGSIVSRNAICFVDTCKYDSTDLNISCKHVKSASECTKQAIELKILKDVLYAMNISNEQKESLWSLYCEEEQMIPAVQRVNKSTFVVKCKANAVQAAGRLHATITADDQNEFNYSCGCRKLRIVLSPNNSVLLENATCDHLTLILAGLLSNDFLRKDYQNFINSLVNLWQTDNFNISGTLLQTEDFISFSEHILNSCIELTSTETSSNERILDSDPTMHTSADNLMEDEEIQLINIPTSAEEINTEFETTNMELAECQIELMDQFKLTNQIDLCNEDIQLCEADLFAENHIVSNIDGIPEDPTEHPFENDSCDVFPKSASNINSDILIHPVIGKEKRPNLKVQENIDIPPTLEFNSWLNFVIEKINSSIDFNSETEVVIQNFDVRQDFFAHLSCKFSVGDKRRIPNTTSLIKKGKYKGLIKSTWIFTNASTVKRIFQSEDICINLESVYMEQTPGDFVPYDTSHLKDNSLDTQDKKLKRILPSMFKAFIQFGNKGKTSTEGFAVEWTPNVFPKSGFGVMRVQFNLGFKKNNKIVERNSTIR